MILGCTTVSTFSNLTNLRFFWIPLFVLYSFFKQISHLTGFLAISGIGGSGQLDPTVAANATVALLAATAIAAITFVPTAFDWLGPRGCLLASGWTYPLYAGSLLCYNRT